MFMDNGINQIRNIIDLSHVPTCLPHHTAREILKAEGNWPRRGRYFPMEQAASDFYVIAAFQHLWHDEQAFNEALARYLG